MKQIKDFFRKVKVESIFAAILGIVLGILFVVMPKASADVLCTICGVILIIVGVVSILAFISQGFIFSSYLLILGISLVLAGIFSVVYPSVVYGILTIVFGIYIIVDGVTSMTDSIILSRVRIKGWFWLFLLSILTITLGVIVMFGSFEQLMMFAGISLIIDGVVDIIEIIVFSHKVKEAKKKILEEHNTIYM